MDLQDYTAPVDFDTEYAPRPKASQLTAAAKRAQRHDTEPITPIAARRAASPRQLVLAAAQLVAGHHDKGGDDGASSGGRPTPLATPQPTTRATDAPAAFAAAPTTPPALFSAPIDTIAVYASPNGALLGPVETDRAMIPVAHHGGDWIQAEVSGSGLVWIRAADMPGLAIVGPDLAPKAPAPAAPRAAQTWSAPPVEIWTIDIPTEKELNGSKAAPSSDWCRGAHLDDPECQNGSKSIVSKQVK